LFLFVKFPSCDTHLKITGRKARIVYSVVFSQDNVVDIMMEDSAIKEIVSQKVLNDLNNECNSLCSTAMPSMLRQKDAESLTNFSFQALLEEIKSRAHLLYSVIMSVCCPKKASERNTQKTVDSKLGSIGMAIAILLRCRNKFMSAAHIVNSISLGRGHISKMVSTCTYTAECKPYIRETVLYN